MPPVLHRSGQSTALPGCPLSRFGHRILSSQLFSPTRTPLRGGGTGRSPARLDAKAVFEVDWFIADCSTAERADPSHNSMCEIGVCAVSDPVRAIAGLGEPK